MRLAAALLLALALLPQVGAAPVCFSTLACYDLTNRSGERNLVVTAAGREVFEGGTYDDGFVFEGYGVWILDNAIYAQTGTTQGDQETHAGVVVPPNTIFRYDSEDDRPMPDAAWCVVVANVPSCNPLR